MKFNIVTKLSVSAIVLVLLTAVSVGTVFYSETIEVLVANRMDHIATNINDSGKSLRSSINNQRKDVRFLAATPPIQGILRRKNANQNDKLGTSSYRQLTGRLQSIFISMFAGNDSYQKVRLISKDGQELVVVVREGDKVVALQAEQLQNKSHRSYVERTLALEAGHSYLSEINLNREHGAVSLPRSQVIRSAIPIIDDQLGDVAGLLIITADVSSNFQAIRNRIRAGSQQVYITNDQGDYLVHPDRNKTYGFDFGHRYKIQTDIALLTTQFFPKNSSDSIILPPDSVDNLRVMIIQKFYFDDKRPQRFIAIGVTELYNDIVDKEKFVIINGAYLTLVLVFLLTFFAVFLAGRISRPIKNITQFIDDYVNQRKSNVTMPVGLSNEIGVLARSFQFLMDATEVAQKNLEEMNLTLETRVHKRTVDLAAARDEAETANHAKSEFLSRMSHELRTPLNAILGFGQIISMDDQNLTEIQKDNINEILQAGAHLLNLINEILDLARIESGDLDLSMSKVEMDDVILLCLPMVGPQAESRKLRLVDNISDKGFSVQADFSKLTQVLVNLLSNAVKYNCEYGRITLDGEIINQQRLRIYISDTGEGLSESDIDRLFNAFERLNAKNNVEGTGIGLVITKHLVEAMGGKIGVQSVLQEGCTFWVEFDLPEAA